MRTSILREVDPLNPGGGRRAIVASSFPVKPPDEWFDMAEPSEPTPLTVTADGQVYGHIAAWNSRHIGLPGDTRPPRSRSSYGYFHTGVVATASGKDVPVGQLTLAGGHASLQADAAAAVKHYDDTASAVADVHARDGQHGIWVAGAMRPSVSEEQVRVLRASAPSGDWRPINGHLELVACCQVNVPGFPLARARVAGGAPLALVAAGASDMMMRRYRNADVSLTERLAELEGVVETLVASVVDTKKTELRSRVKSA